MSYISAVIVITSLWEETAEDENKIPVIEFINRRKPASHGDLIQVDQYTNGKHPESLIFIAGYNYLNLKDFKKAIYEAPWKRPEIVQILFRDQNEDRFRLFQLSNLEDLQ